MIDGALEVKKVNRTSGSAVQVHAYKLSDVQGLSCFISVVCNCFCNCPIVRLPPLAINSQWGWTQNVRLHFSLIE
jgi:hypothetical protein